MLRKECGEYKHLWQGVKGYVCCCSLFSKITYMATNQRILKELERYQMKQDRMIITITISVAITFTIVVILTFIVTVIVIVVIIVQIT